MHVELRNTKDGEIADESAASKDGGAFVMTMSSEAPNELISRMERYTQGHGHHFVTCEPVSGVTGDWIACCAIERLLQSYTCVFWMPRQCVITNAGVMLQEIADLKSNEPMHLVRSAAFGSVEALPDKGLLSDCLAVRRCPETMRFFSELLALKHWSGVTGGVDRAVDELMTKDPSLRSLVRWAWTPKPKSFRSAVSSPEKNKEASVRQSWKYGDFIARLPKGVDDACAPEVERLLSAVSDHGIAWQSRKLASRIGPMATDKRHIGWMRTFLLSKKWRTSLEIGCLGGASSVAFVDAVNEQTLLHAHFCDRRFTPEFREVINSCRGAYTLHEEDSCASFSRFGRHELEFVYVDGDHSLETLQRECHQLARLKPAVVAAHDVVGDEGPGYLMVQLQRDGYYCLIDFKRRKGEGTHRGFLIACREFEDYQLALEAYKRHIW
ncbi:class I SAM-dependent methyltransferase [Verrucomicrobium spinosum]|uniref:class I SAM-dependent methyltransferase n=1 Tax=Verrucomicrobium spinosum TaxID=2736 RepID=UPI0012F6B1CA|nr:class I SAM-dependent methyltransferase [Verrucomicrobium spinosum]